MVIKKKIVVALLELPAKQHYHQMLGCGAHVRKIALPHVRCACGSACGKVF